MGDSLDELKDAVDSPIEGEVWLDDDGRVHRFTYSFEVEGLATTTTAEYFDFGTPVDLTIPPADAVVAYAEVKDEVDALIRGDTSSVPR